jgi:hypothetical protein
MMIRRFFFLLLLVAFAATAHAKDEVHMGKLIYHASTEKNLATNDPDAYHISGGVDVPDVTCIGGDEHNAPDCMTDMEWALGADNSYEELQFGNGAVVTSRDLDKSGSVDLGMLQLALVMAEFRGRATGQSYSEPFSYTLGKKSKFGSQKVCFVAAGSSAWSGAPKATRYCFWMGFR